MAHEQQQQQPETRTVEVFGTRISLSSLLTLAAGVVIATGIGLFSPLLGVLALLSFSVISYNINCLHFGHCHTFAWILTGFYVFYAVFIVVGAALVRRMRGSPKPGSGRR